MPLALDTYFEIVPEYSDPDTYVRFTVSNGFCRASLKIYADLSALANLADALAQSPFSSLSPESLFDFEITEEMCMNIGFAVLSSNEPKQRVFRVLVVDTDPPNAYRAQIDISMNEEEAREFSNDLNIWIRNPVTHFIWKQ
jgi:hypothetical protein